MTRRTPRKASKKPPKRPVPAALVSRRPFIDTLVKKETRP
jgi:hypothetical protein